LRALQRVLGDIRAVGAELVGVTPETPEKIEGTAGQAAAEFPILHDAGNAFARSLGLVFELPESLRPRYVQLGIDLPEYNGDATFTLPVPATYVIGHDGVVLWAFVDADFTRRAEPEDILRALRAGSEAA
jgi:peroxiredoxin